MSSHHFVKEGQEPALFILEAFSFGQATPLLEWSPLVIVADRVVDAVLGWGIKIDIVLQQKYGLEKLDEMLLHQSPLQIIPCGSMSSLEKGLEFLVERKYQAVNFVTDLNSDFFNHAGKFAKSLQIVAFTERQKCSLISSGKFEKWMDEGSKLKIFRSDEQPITIRGLVETGEEWVVGPTEMVHIESKSPFWVGELV